MFTLTIAIIAFTMGLVARFILDQMPGYQAPKGLRRVVGYVGQGLMTVLTTYLIFYFFS